MAADGRGLRRARGARADPVRGGGRGAGAGDGGGVADRAVAAGAADADVVIPSIIFINLTPCHCPAVLLAGEVGLGRGHCAGAGVVVKAGQGAFMEEIIM